VYVVLTERLKQIREDHGLSQKELSHALGFKSPNVMGMYERGERKPNYETIKEIANYFNISADYLLDHKSTTLHPKTLELAKNINQLSNSDFLLVKQIVNRLIEAKKG